MKRERTLPEKPAANRADLVDASATAKILRLRAAKSPAWDPYEVWRTRVKPKAGRENEKPTT